MIPIGPGLIERRLRVAPSEVAWLRYVLEAHDGLASFFTTGDGTVILIAPEALATELDRLIEDLVAEGTASRET